MQSSVVQTSTTAAPTIPASPTSTGTSSSASGLSTGSKIGIGVGIPLALLALAGALLLLWRHRRRRHPHDPTKHSSCPTDNDLPEVHYTPLAPTPASALTKGGSTITPTPAPFPMSPLSSPSPTTAFTPHPRGSLASSAPPPPPASLPDFLPPPVHQKRTPAASRLSGTTAMTAGGGVGAAFAPQDLHEAPGSSGWGGGDACALPGLPPPSLGAAALEVPGLASAGGSVGGGAAGGGSDEGESGGLYGDDRDEIVRLRREAQRLQERRRRLTQMNQLDEEEERVVGRLRELEGRGVVY
ncbi:uncharacterized protein LTHEOB_8013 [Neofusicoccum parvum]|uniref:Uncharacterized protein LTHEOB_8013 n=1 Tax=Neofusicoccum parvum TaxID=310453 RepID=A0ACB5SMC4_9PEZI|nr:uncharacterized protein LTHEOB_8013 [Neofusicoccum parvum]